jgi:outer membrane usher protein
MLRFHWSLCVRSLLVLALLFPLSVFFGLKASHADQMQENLQLEVFINGVPANMISSFVRFADGKIGAAQSELEELGLRTPSQRAATELVRLDEIPTLKYEYVEQAQKMLITVDDSARIPHA